MPKTSDNTAKLRPYLYAIKRAVDRMEEILEEDPLIPFEVDDECADALRWLEENVIV